VAVALGAASGGLAADVAAVAAAERAGKLRIMITNLRSTMLVALVMVAAGASSGCSYNAFVAKEEGIKTQWAQVENQLQRRNDLIPNLVETTKGIAQQEKDVFGQIADSRARLAGAKTPQESIEAANQQSAALARLLVVMENYPQLRSSETFNRLMDELSGTENRIAVERMRYNERVQDYNTSRRQFPSNVSASLFGFKEYPLFDAPKAAEQVPKVNFGRGTN
jgi:LemA protein